MTVKKDRLEVHREGKLSPSSGKTNGKEFALMFLLLFTVISVLLGGVYLPDQTLFSNDGPLGRLMSHSHHLPERFTGCWQDLNSVGYSEGAAVPGITYGLQWLLKPVGFSKLYVPVALLILGLGAWFFFRQSGLAPPACILGGLAATLNSSFFSAACWGIAAHAITVGMTFLALAALADTSSRQRWPRVMLAGLAVGVGVIEGADLGALFSLLVAAFVVYQAVTAEGPRTRTLAAGTGRAVLVAVCAGLVAAQAISQLVATDIKGVLGTQQDARTRAEHWAWATKWSLPKKEALALVVPGLFGYRDDTPDGGGYWGETGRDAEWDQYLEGGAQGPPPKGFARFAGGGFYAGVAVVLLAIWGVAQSLRRKDSVFNLSQRKWLWFWAGIGFVSLLLAFGRYAPFYRLFYTLPYVSTIRNPVKFLHLLDFALIIMFAYGVDGLWRRHLQAAGSRLVPQWKADRFNQRWIQGCFLALGISLLAWMVYYSYSEALEGYLQTVLFDAPTARLISKFSVSQVGWFVLFFVLAASLQALILRGAFLGARARWGAVLLGLLLLTDLGRANQPWILYLNYPDVYASNPIVDRLREKAWEQRVAILPFHPPPKFTTFNEMYRSEWLQHLFPYYDIQSLDITQMPREPEDLAAFGRTFEPGGRTNAAHLVTRYWQLTNTRYLLGGAGFLDLLNERPDVTEHPVRVVDRFKIVRKRGNARKVRLDELSVESAADGPYALFEFTGVLPRAKLYSDWQVNTNDQATLEELAGTSFDPEQSVLVAGGLPPAALGSAGTNQNGGSVEFASYAPKEISLKTDVPASSVLLLNDRFDPNWKVWVDRKPATVLRCNYLMRGVYLEPGRHTVEFRFQPQVRMLYVSLAAMGAGLLLLGVVMVSGFRGTVQTGAPVVNQRPNDRAQAPNPQTPPTGTPAGKKRPASKPASKART